MNVLDYLTWRGDLTLEERPFNEIDGLALGQLSFNDWSGVVPAFGQGSIAMKDAAPLFKTLHRFESQPQSFLNLRSYYDMAIAMGSTKRFGNAQLSAYRFDIDAASEKQFGALTITLDDGTVFVSFRGTDSTLVGWKEDFNIALICPTPAQQSAVSYLNDIIGQTKAQIKLGGHSKGGNLAMYAGVMCYQPQRISDIYSNDGPGFTSEFIASPEFIANKHLIHRYVPQTSVVGMLMLNPVPYTVVFSDSRDVVWQHNGYSWQVERDHFITVDHLTDDCKKIDAITDSWITKISDEDKEKFFNAFYNAMVESGMETLDDLPKCAVRLAPKLLSSIKEFDEGEKQLFTEIIELALRIAGYNVKERFTPIRPKRK